MHHPLRLVGALLASALALGGVIGSSENAQAFVHPVNYIDAYAGTGISAHLGDGGQAASAGLADPRSIAVSLAGDVYIAEANQIRKVDNATRVITTFAGTGAASFGGDGGPAAGASFNGITSIAFDPSGNLFVADSGNKRIRQITSGGTVSTYAGGGSSIGLEGTLTTNARFTSGIRDLAVDSSGRLYFASGDWAIYTIAATDHLIHKALDDFKGTQIAVDASGRLFAPDRRASTINFSVWDPTAGSNSVLATTVGDWTDLVQVVNDPTSGLLFVAAPSDFGGHDTWTIYAVDPRTGSSYVLAGGVGLGDSGNGGRALGSSVHPGALAVSPTGILYFVAADDTVRVISCGTDGGWGLAVAPTCH